jgi:hypothetical protein
MQSSKQNYNVIPFDLLTKTRRPNEHNTDVPSWSSFAPTAGDYCYDEILHTPDVHRAQATAKYLRSVFTTNELEQLFGLHPTLDMITVSQAFHYTVFHTYEYLVNLTLDQVKQVHTTLQTLYRRTNRVHGCICPLLLGKVGDRVILRPPLQLLDANSGDYNKIMMTSIIITPLQIMIDMLSSTYEKELIEYQEFRVKFQRYWEHMLPNGPLKQQIPAWISQTFSSVAGCLDYVDFAINRYCIVVNDAGGKQCIRKTPSKALGYLFDIDTMAFCICTFLMQRPMNTEPSPEVIKYMGSMIRGDVSPVDVCAPSDDIIPRSTSKDAAPHSDNIIPVPIASEEPSRTDSASPPPSSSDRNKRMYKGQMRLVRTDEQGDYILWQKQKIYV